MKPQTLLPFNLQYDILFTMYCVSYKERLHFCLMPYPMPWNWRRVPMITYSKEYEEKVRSLWCKYIEKDTDLPEGIEGIRPIIYESWKRSKAYQVSPLEIKDKVLDEASLKKVISYKKDLISVAHSYIHNLYSFVKGSNFIIALTDEQGYVIDMIGHDAQIQARAKRSGLSIGCNRSEKYAGTNGIGTCLFTEQPIQIWGSEHYIKPHHNYVCSAAPIKNSKGAVIGCLDVIGPTESISSHTLAMVCAAVDGIEKEMKMKEAYEKIFIINNQLISTIQSISSGIIMFDNMGIITQYNSRAAQILRLPSGHLSNKNIANILDISTASINLLNINKNISNKEVSVVNSFGIKINLSISASIIYSDSHEKISTVLIIEELQRLHKMVSKLSGFTAKYTFDSIIGNSPAMKEVKELGIMAAQSDSNVLLLGESGTGKDILAQAIHNSSARADGPFISINCGSLPKGLIESELFGYEAGSFTGARKDGNPGKFELASGGTIFLDEIGDMPLEMQTSLLRVIQSKELMRVGGKTTKQVDVRIIAATNVDLLESINNKKFRSDLYYRLNVLNFVIPSLRQRREDIPILIDYFINSYNESMKKEIKGISPVALNLMNSYGWPGNVRELENVIERAMNLAQTDIITENELPYEIVSQNAALSRHSEDPGRQLRHQEKRTSREYEMIINALEREEGNVKRVSDLLGIPRRTLYRKVEKYNIDLKAYRTWP